MRELARCGTHMPRGTGIPYYGPSSYGRQVGMQIMCDGYGFSLRAALPKWSMPSLRQLLLLCIVHSEDILLTYKLMNYE